MASPDHKPVDIAVVQKLTSLGLDDCPAEDRCVSWLLLSGIMPKQIEEWPAYREHLVASYKNFMNMFNLADYVDKTIPNTTRWFDFGVENNEKMLIIHADIVRTMHHIIFLPYPDESVDRAEAQKDPLLPYHEHMRRLERILYLFAMLNENLSYLQGFNELICVIYYAMSSGFVYFNDWLEVEAFSFYIFQNIFSCTRLGDLFIMKDQMQLVNERLTTFMNLVKKHVPVAYNIITKLKISPLTFGLKWLNLLFAQDHLMPNLVIIWDVLFAHFDDLMEFGYYIAAANIALIENNLSPTDYSVTLVALQRTEVNDIKGLLKRANQFWKVDHTRKWFLNFD